MTGKEIMDEVGQLLEATAGMDLAHPNVMQTYKYGTQESLVSRAALPGSRWRVALKLARLGLQQALWRRLLAWPGLQCQAAGGEVAARYVTRAGPTRAGSHVLLRGTLLWMCCIVLLTRRTLSLKLWDCTRACPREQARHNCRQALGFHLWA